MAFRDYLAAFLLGFPAFLFPYNQDVKAEDKEVRVEFQDKDTRGIPVIGKPDLEGIIKASAWIENNIINISIRTNNCYIEEHTRIFLGLQIDADPIQIKQTATVQTRNGEKTVDINSSSLLKEVDKIIGKGIIKLSDNIPFFSNLVELVQFVGGKEDRKIEQKMRKEHRLLLRELPLHIRFILNPINSLHYEISIDRELTETPRVIAQIALKDEYGRTTTTGNVNLRCDEGTRRPLTQTQANVPKNLEQFLLTDPQLNIVKNWTSELPKILEQDSRGVYILEYRPKANPEDFSIFELIISLRENNIPINSLEELERINFLLDDVPNDIYYGFGEYYGFIPRRFNISIDPSRDLNAGKEIIRIGAFGKGTNVIFYGGILKEGFRDYHKRLQSEIDQQIRRARTLEERREIGDSVVDNFKNEFKQHEQTVKSFLDAIIRIRNFTSKNNLRDFENHGFQMFFDDMLPYYFLEENPQYKSLTEE